MTKATNVYLDDLYQTTVYLWGLNQKHINYLIR